MIIMMMVPRADDTREYLTDMMLRAPGSVMERLETVRGENDQGRDLAGRMLEGEEDNQHQPDVMGEQVDGDQPQDMDTEASGEEAGNTEVKEQLMND